MRAGVDDYGVGGVVMAGDGDVGGAPGRIAAQRGSDLADDGGTAPVMGQIVAAEPPGQAGQRMGGGAAETVDGLIRVGDDDQRQADVVELVEDLQVGGGAVLRLVDHQFGA